MRRRSLLAGLLLAVQPVVGSAHLIVAAGTLERTYALRGQIAGYRLAGVEPDGDPLYQTVLQTKLSAQPGQAAPRLIVSSYLENFKPDTTPILVDLLHPNRKATNLGGFLQGKALLTDDAGSVLSIGSFLAEAFLDNSNHTAIRFLGTGGSSAGELKGTFTLQKSGALQGVLFGHLSLSAANLRQLERHRGARMKPLKQIISAVTVKPAPMMGKQRSGSTSAPLRTGFQKSPKVVATPTTPASTRRLSPITIVAGIGAVLSLLLAIYLFWSDRRKNPAPS